MDNAIHGINHYLVNSTACLNNIYPLDILWIGLHWVYKLIHPLRNWAQGEERYCEHKEHGHSHSIPFPSSHSAQILNHSPSLLFSQ